MGHKGPYAPLTAENGGRMFLLIYHIGIIALLLLHQKSNALPEPPPTSNQALSALNSWHSYRCDSSSNGRPDAAIDCITVLGQLEQEPTSAQQFQHRIWTSRETGCQFSAQAKAEMRAPAIVVPDVLDDLFFLLYRCFQADRSRPSKAASIQAGVSFSYDLTLWPPPPPTPSSTNIPKLKNLALDDRRPLTQCRKRAAGRLDGKYTDCLPILLGWYNAPGSAEEREWKEVEGTNWSAPACSISLDFTAFEATPDRFSLRSLINNAVWIMGKYFAGPEAARGINEGYMSVGPRRMWTMRIIWGTTPRLTAE